MSSLLLAPTHQLLALEERARRCCLAFNEEPLPPGTSQPTARVGIEIDPDTGRSLLHVERGIYYAGPSDDLAAWFASGTRVFEDYDELRGWLAGPLAAAYADGAPNTEDLAAPITVPPLLVDPVHMQSVLTDELIGQQRSIDQMVAATALHLARRVPRRPLTALALGPTGVGKTLLAESVATAIGEVSGQPCGYLRIDMTEFQERHSVSKLLGAPPGYVGFGDDSPLVETLRNNTRAVIHIDEVEKAHADVFLAIMNLMDAGRLTPAQGPVVDARHAILIFTTNLGADVLAERLATTPSIGDDVVVRDALVRQTLRTHGIVPELVGRLHTLLVFDPLHDEHLDEILHRSIVREAATFGLEVDRVGPEVLAHLKKHRPDPGSGVRAWEHLIAVELGPALLDACRQNVSGAISVQGIPPAITPSP
ncbi:AAA family ATPase [Mycobacterium sp. ZZG]